MPARNVIQFRRGYSMGYSGPQIGDIPVGSGSWTGGIQLAEGEVGYEIDTGKFKIGRRNAGGSLITWENLDYGGGGGGGGIIPGSGIGILVNPSGDDTLYSVLTNTDNNLSIVENSLSSIIPNATGTYYDVKLANNISVSGTIASSGINLRNITESITVTEAIGAIPAGTVFNSGNAITTILKQILEKVFEPTIGQNPGVIMSLSGSVSPAGSSASFTNAGRYEVGTTGNITVSSTLDQGWVRGSGLGANWVESGNQGVRAGAATAYNRTLTGGLTNSTFATSNTFNNYSVVLGSNIASGIITHNSGITPKNSLGVNSTTLTVLASGLTVTGSHTFTGVRRLFYSFDTTSSAPTTSADIRALNSTGATFESSKSIWDFGVNTVFRVTPPVGTRRVVVAVPSGLYSLGNTITVLDETSLNANISSSYILTTINVSGANGASAVPYNVYTFIPDSPFANSATHRITLN